MLKETSYEKLSEQIYVCISKEHRFGTDAFLIAQFSKPRHKDQVCDLGCGCGIIPMILERDFQPKIIFGIDIQPNAIALFKRSIERSEKADKIFPLQCDLKELSKEVPTGYFDVVTCNPPYFSQGAGILSEMGAQKIARHETMCTIDDICNAANRLLKFGGKLCVCQRPSRLTDVLIAMRNADIEPKKVQFVAKNQTTQPWLVLIEGKKGSKPFLNVEPTLTIDH